MRLKSLKLVGFKSFVDPTTIPFPTNLTAIVGPNGCGKSNIVDAIRWVMGETSAKHLRGESMTDVIFNGSTARKPVGQASVELVFDNNDATLQGEYAKYSEIAIKRQLNREGESTYFLNGTKCRRKDVQDVFLGTGIGTRNSYSIIEQGMISRFIEAKPDDLRLFIEEAAGVSKYKERRRETETRIRHTRENLERLIDVRDEVAKQIEHLQRQANAAEKYKVLKQDERLMKAQLLALHWQDMDNQIQNHDSIIQEKQIALEERVAEQRRIDTEIERLRQQQIDSGDVFNEVQARYYSVGAEISRLEQSIAHHRERWEQLQADNAEVEQAWEELTHHLANDKENISQWSAELAELEPRFELATASAEASSDVLETAEQTMNEWQAQWDSFNQRASQTAQQASVERTRVQHLEQQIERTQQRLAQIQSEHSEINPNAFDAQITELQAQQELLQSQIDEQQHHLTDIRASLNQQRDNNQQYNDQLDAARSEVQTLRGRQASLLALQQAATGSGNGSATAWLAHHDLQNKPRLAQKLTIESGWETAVETVLGTYLEAVCVEDVAKLADFNSLQQGQIALFEKNDRDVRESSNLGALLAEHVSGEYSVASLMAGIHCVATLPEALQLREKLNDDQSVVTKDGIWFGKQWLRVAKIADAKTSIIAREQELKTITEKLTELTETVEKLQFQLVEGKEQLQTLEQDREATQQQLNQIQQQFADVKAKANAQLQNRDRILQRVAQLEKELTESNNQLEKWQADLTTAQENLTLAEEQASEDALQREQLAAARGTYRAALENSRDKASSDKELVHQLTLQIENRRTQKQAADANVKRMEEQLQAITQRRETLKASMEEGESPVLELEEQLQEVLERRVLADKELVEARRNLENLTHQLQQFDRQRNDVLEQVDSLRESVQRAKLDFQTLDVRRETYAEQVVAMDLVLTELLQQMPAEAEISVWEQDLQTIANKIQRLGAINLAAIDELKSNEERKVYLDAQFADLEDALNVLETAIKKIDKETKDRFQETFDQINSGFAELFPKVFGGGSARLELVGDELLETGVMVMAHPPGKRNSTIHMLSGGEKALTAISLVFAIFRLNPAPFCLLDEVDAPLDESNVRRYCNLVQEMSKSVQFMFISHNKVTIEMGEQLMGVTMHEPGVSRIVSVNINEAVEMATA